MLFCDEPTQPALTTRRDRVISIPAYTIFLDNGFMIVFHMVNSPQ
jgi:hypothetical protein